MKFNIYFSLTWENKFIGYHHLGGPITIETPRFHSSMKQAFHEAAKELGYQFVDPNGAKQTGKKI